MANTTNAANKNGTPGTGTTSMEDLLGKFLLVQQDSNSAEQSEKPTSEVVGNQKFVLLYFSASWCPPCKRFSPILVEFYNKHAKEEKIEIVYVSSDKSIQEFQQYYNKMPWTAIPPNSTTTALKNQLAQKLKIVGIPTLVVLTKDGKFVTDQARRQIEQTGSWTKIIQEWNQTEAVPISQAQLTDPTPNPIVKFLMEIIKKPAFIFAFLYFVKWAMAKWKELYPSAEQQQEL